MPRYASSARRVLYLIIMPYSAGKFGRPLRIISRFAKVGHRLSTILSELRRAIRRFGGNLLYYGGRRNPLWALRENNRRFTELPKSSRNYTPNVGIPQSY